MPQLTEHGIVEADELKLRRHVVARESLDDLQHAAIDLTFGLRTENEAVNLRAADIAKNATRLLSALQREVEAADAKGGRR